MDVAVDTTYRAEKKRVHESRGSVFSYQSLSLRFSLRSLLMMMMMMMMMMV
jgi:hypothetical protein